MHFHISFFKKYQLLNDSYVHCEKNQKNNKTTK